MGAGRSTHSDGSPAQSPTRLLDGFTEARRIDEHGFHGALLSPNREFPTISSPPPRTDVDDRLPSPPPASSRVPVVIRMTSSSGERRHSMRADSPMPKLQVEARRLSDPRDDQAHAGKHQLSDLESQIREIEQMTDGILEDIEAENLGSFSTGHDPSTKAKRGPHQDSNGPLDTGKSAAPLRGSFERSLFSDTTKFSGLGRPQLPPTRSLEHGGRRASVPWEAAVAGFRSGGHRYKPHSRSPASEVRSQSQPVAGLAVTGGHGTHTRTMFGTERTYSPFLLHEPRNTMQNNEQSYDFSKFHRANQREKKGHSLFGGHQPDPVSLAADKQRSSNTTEDLQDRANHSSPSEEGGPVEYDVSEKLILEDIEKEYSVT
ncbi:hypothetical protein MRX96_006626 [Rhipicephalus microplus]